MEKISEKKRKPVSDLSIYHQFSCPHCGFLTDVRKSARGIHRREKCPQCKGDVRETVSKFRELRAKWLRLKKDEIFKAAKRIGLEESDLITIVNQKYRES